MSGQEDKGNGHITQLMSDREQVEKTADRFRDELLLTLEELERRRERALDVKYQLRRAYEQNRDLVLTVGGVGFALLGLGVGYAVWRARHHERVMWHKRRRAVRRAWEHPDRLASSAEERPFGLELGRKLVLIFGTALATALAKNSVQSLVPPASRRAHGRVRVTQAPAYA